MPMVEQPQPNVETDSDNDNSDTNHVGQTDTRGSKRIRNPPRWLGDNVTKQFHGHTVAENRGDLWYR